MRSLWSDYHVFRSLLSSVNNNNNQVLLQDNLEKYLILKKIDSLKNTTKGFVQTFVITIVFKIVFKS